MTDEPVANLVVEPSPNELRDPLVRPGAPSSAEEAAQRLVAWLTQREQEGGG